MLRLCKENTNTIAKHFLNLYKVDYKDPTNFIYVMDRKDINDYKNGERYKYGSILKLYMKHYYKHKIRCNNKNITSFPIYPNMETCEINNNQLRTFPIQPVMIYCYINNNNLTTFPIQPIMKACKIDHNNLTTFPIQPRMIDCEISNNQLISFSSQPIMTTCYINNNNKLKKKRFEHQPVVIICNGCPI